MPAIPAPTSALNWYARRAAIQFAVMQRCQVAHKLVRWPECVREWDFGTVPGNLTETTFTDASKTLWDPTKGIPWEGIDPPFNDTWQTPLAWRVVFTYDPCDYTADVFADVTAIASGGGLTFTNVRDYATAKIIPSVASLIGKRYSIIRYGGLPNHPWYSEQLLEWPNARAYAEGLVGVGSTNQMMVVATPPRPRFRPSELVAKDLLVYANDGFLKRVTVTAATRGDPDNPPSISFAAQSWTPAAGSAFIVVKANARALPGRMTRSAFAHYRGYRKGYPSHDVDDTVQSMNMPETYLHIPGADTMGGCTGNDVIAYGQHWYVGELSLDDLTCGTGVADKVYTPDVYKTITGLQSALLSAAREFVASDYAGGTEPPATLGEARALQKAGINAFSSTTTTIDGGGISSNTINFGAMAFPRTPIEVYWSVKQTDGEWKHGVGLANSTTQLTAYPESDTDVFFATDTEGPHDEGRAIVVSLGLTCPAPLQFRYMREKTVWIADTNEFGAIDPPATDYATSACQGTGRWVLRPASTHYLDARYPQAVIPSAKGDVREGDQAFADGEIARWVGENFQDASVRDEAGLMMDLADVLVPYYDRYYTGEHPKTTAALLRARLKGKATSGSKTQLTDLTKNFWASWYGGGVLKTISGTATGGSTLGFSDTTQASGEPACWWADTVFSGFDPHVGFVAEIVTSGTGFTDPAAVIEKRFITASDNTVVSVTWGVATSASASGRPWRIRWPKYELNEFKGLKCTLRKPDPDNPGTTLVEVVTLLGNDDQTLFFPAIPWDVDETTTYKIDYPIPGGVYRRVSGAWEPAAGGDAIRYGVTVPTDFLKNINNNLEDHVKRYGRSCARDTACRLLDDQMIALLGVLTRTRDPGDWTGDGSNNDKTNVAAGNDEGYSGTWSNLQTDTETNFDGTTAIEVDNAAPLATANGHISLIPPFETPPQPTGKDALVSRRKAKLHVTLFQPICGIPAKIRYFNYAGINATDSAPVADCIEDPTNPGHYIWTDIHFDANGDPVSYHQWTEWYADAAYSATTNRLSDWLGEITTAPVPIEPVAGGCFNPTTDGGVTGDYLLRTETGYAVLNKWAVIDWQFADLIP